MPLSSSVPVVVSDPIPQPLATILVVDDTPANLTVIGELLSPHYRVRVANSGERALAAVKTAPRPDLILLDIMMPGLDGYGVLAQLQANADMADVPVIFVTAMSADEDEEQGLALGAVDYVTKPIRPAILLARVKTHLELKRARDWLRDQNGYLEHEVARRMAENELVKDVSLHALALLAEKRDNETGNHLLRTQAYVQALIDQLQDHPRFSEALREPWRSWIVKAAPLHDIGKVGIPDHILLKPGRLTPDEFAVMKQHSQIGADAIAEAIERVLAHPPQAAAGAESSEALAFLRVAHDVALNHHERWDGQGYPAGLAGDAIPVAGRLMALADVFDALSCRRHYKAAMPLEDVHALLLAGRGSHFDPDVVDAYLAQRAHFAAIARQYRDEPQGGGPA